MPTSAPVLRVLLVEDNPLDRLRIEAALRRLHPGVRLVAAEGLREARQKLQEQQHDIALVDWELPDGTGAELLPAALRLDPPLPIVLLTRGDVPASDRTVAAGAQDFLPKRCIEEGETLRRALRNALDRARWLRDDVARRQVASDQERWAALSRLAGGVAHDLNNALAVVRAGLDLLEAAGPRRPDEQEALEESQAAVAEAARRCRQLLTFAGSDPQASESLDLTALFGASSGPRLPVRGDRAQLVRVIEGLQGLCAALGQPAPPVLGAQDARACPSDRWITPPPTLGDCSTATLRFHGGPAPTTRALQQAFEPFADGARAASLDLPALLGILRAHGGALSGGPLDAGGEGGELVLWLPELRAAGPEARRPRAATVRLDAATIFVVDDDPRIRRAVRRALESAGAAVDEHPDATSALQALRGGARCDYLLTDLLMPGPSGLELLRALAADGRLPPSGVMTGYSEEAPRIAQMPDVDIFLKPFAMKDLTGRIAARLRGTSAEPGGAP